MHSLNQQDRLLWKAAQKVIEQFYLAKPLLNSCDEHRSMDVEYRRQLNCPAASEEYAS